MPKESARVVVAEQNPELERLFVKKLEISPLIAKILVNRGFTDVESAEKFLSPRLDHFHSPKLLPDYDVAEKTILNAKNLGQRIYVHGDYDADGVTSAAILDRCLGCLGFDVVTKVPLRSHGFGLNLSAVRDAKEMGAKLIITCDNGTGSISEVQAARELGINVVVTDHHPPKGELPNANAVVNPHRTNSVYPFSGLSGAGVAFKLCLGLSDTLGLKREKFFDKFLDLAAIGTVADSVTLLDENRIIAAHGLDLLWKTQKPGLRALIEKSIPADKRAKYQNTRDSSAISFQLAPRLNAIGRVEDPGIALKLLVSRCHDESFLLVENIEIKNNERKIDQMRIEEEAVALVESFESLPNFIVVASDSWNPGIAGIVAGRLKEKYGRPALVLGLDATSKNYRGSIRSIPGIHAGEAVESIPHLLKGGGHPGAAGATVIGGDLEMVAFALDQIALKCIPEIGFGVVHLVDMEIKLDDLSIEDAYLTSLLAPYGHSNPEPLFLIRNFNVESILSISQGRFAKLFIKQNSGVNLNEFMFWCDVEAVRLKFQENPQNIIATLSINSFQGKDSVQWTIRDVF